MGVIFIMVIVFILVMGKAVAVGLLASAITYGAWYLWAPEAWQSSIGIIALTAFFISSLLTVIYDCD